MSVTETSLHGEPAASGETLDAIKTLIRNGRFDDAVVRIRGFLESGPGESDEIEALYMLAVSQRYTRQFDAALATLEVLLSKDPDYSRAWQEQGHLYLALNDSDRATRAFTRAVQRNPSLIASWKALVNLHGRAGREQDAGRARQQVSYLVQLPPELISVLNFLHEGNLYKAEHLCRAFLQRNKDHIEGMRLLAEIGIRLKVYDDAEFLLESAVEFAPDHLPARVDYLNVLIRKTRWQQAYEQASILVEREPDNPAFRSSLATTLVGLGRFEEGIALYREILEQHPAQHELYLLIGHAQKTIGDFDDAVESYRTAYHIKPDFGDAFWSLANTKTYRFTDEEIEYIRFYEQSDDISTEDRIHMCFAAGKALEDRGEFDESFDYYERGNDLKRRQSGYDPPITDRRVHAQTEICTRELFEQRNGVGAEHPDPIFIVGLPRAGSTLLEQILASHSMVDGTMELHNILGLAQRLRGRNTEETSRYPAILQELEDDYFRRFGEQYIENTRVYRAGAPFFIDKMPNNFLHIGLIRLILPNAKIIDARRNPMACCFSGFKQLFGEGQYFTYGLHEIGRYYRAYVQLMDHWDEVLPGFVLRVMHEDVVDDLEGQVRRILEFCNLHFEQSCLEYHKTERSVRTPSSEQVRQPIYRSSVEQWRNYEKHLGPLKEALGPDILARYPDR
ncbi:MAG: sulfotransferase [Gammaproteobacteria bacterium]